MPEGKVERKAISVTASTVEERRYAHVFYKARYILWWVMEWYEI